MLSAFRFINSHKYHYSVLCLCLHPPLPSMAPAPLSPTPFLLTPIYTHVLLITSPLVWGQVHINWQGEASVCSQATRSKVKYKGQTGTEGVRFALPLRTSPPRYLIPKTWLRKAGLRHQLSENNTSFHFPEGLLTFRTAPFNTTHCTKETVSFNKHQSFPPNSHGKIINLLNFKGFKKAKVLK